MSLPSKVLVANRGEIACRVFDTCRRLGVQTVAVFSEQDAQAKHALYADEAYCIGPAESNQSYLNMDAILWAVAESGAAAVHPGYGFLSENADFSAALHERGVAFLGPERKAIEAMGDKIESKRIALQAGVNCIPGFEGEVDTVADATKIANEVGYPIMLKASAGGGGKGMRMARSEAEVAEGFELAREEALASFGDDRILIERFIERPRHIEIQVLLDKHGNEVYLNERECSVQRRNQKVLEEAPSIFLDEDTRAAMGEQALKLAREVDYCSAGTVEFLVDPQRNFYFLEMNTRLQVEHPVTELITGVDLVEQMIRIGGGLPMTLAQGDVPAAGERGWAVEARVYAENPQNDFLPSIGKVSRYQEPVGEGIRCDSGIVEGSEISVYYDPMISKLIAHAPTREEACERLASALDSYVIGGVEHNTPFLRECLLHPDFLSGNLTTAFIEENFPEGYGGTALGAEQAGELEKVAAALYWQSQAIAAAAADSGVEFGESGAVAVAVQLGEGLRADGGGEAGSAAATATTVWIEGTMDGGCAVATDPEGPFTPVDLEWASERLQHVSIGDQAEAAPLQLHSSPVAGAQGGVWRLQWLGAVGDVAVRPLRTAELEFHMPVPVALDTHKFVLSPMPGRLVSLAVEEGSEVLVGQPIAVLEAMKMQNVIRAERAGVIKTVHSLVGATLQPEDILVEFDDEPVPEE